MDKRKWEMNIKKGILILYGLCSFCLTIFYSDSVYAGKKISLNKSSITMFVGAKKQLKVKNVPKKAVVKWSSNKKKVATVSKKGLVTAKKKGTAKITAKVKGKKYTCKVTVKVKSAQQTTTENNTAEKTDNQNNQTTQQQQNDTNNKSTEKTDNQDNNTDNSTIVIKDISFQFDEVITKKDSTVDSYTPYSFLDEMGAQLIFSDGSSKIGTNLSRYTYTVTISEFDISTVGKYDVDLSITYNGETITKKIKVSVCEEKQNDDFKYYGDDKIAFITSYVGESEDMVVPEKLDGADVVDGYLIYRYSDVKVKTISLPKTWRNRLIASANSTLYDGYYLEEIMVDEDNPYLSSENGVLFDKEKTILYAYPINKNDEEYLIPDTVVDVSQRAFFNCKNLKKLTITKNVNKILVCHVDGNEGKLSEIVVEDGNPKYKSIDGVLFSDYQVWDEDLGESGEYKRIYNLISYPVAKEDERYEIPDGVSAVGSMNGNKFLKELVVPASVNSWTIDPLLGVEDIKIYFDFLQFTPEQEYQNSFRVVADVLEGDGGTIYVRSDEVKNKVLEFLNDEYRGYSEYWTISNDYSW